MRMNHLIRERRRARIRLFALRAKRRKERKISLSTHLIVCPRKS